jgi:Cu-Zn family superoxide dismutase
MDCLNQKIIAKVISLDFIFMNGTSCTGNSNDEFANAKGHYNPENCPHPYHTGDLPPLLENNGYSYMSIFLNKFKIKDILGKIIIIHDMPDDFTTQPSGNSGTKIACGKIKKLFNFLVCFEIIIKYEKFTKIKSI